MLRANETCTIAVYTSATTFRSASAESRTDVNDRICCKTRTHHHPSYIHHTYTNTVHTRPMKATLYSSLTMCLTRERERGWGVERRRHKTSRLKPSSVSQHVLFNTYIAPTYLTTTVQAPHVVNTWIRGRQ